MNMPQPHTKNRPARWPSPVSGTIGSRDGWKDLIRMTQEPAMQQAIDKAKNAVHLRIRRLSQQSSTASLILITQLACAQELAAKSGINTTNKQHGLM